MSNGVSDLVTNLPTMVAASVIGMHVTSPPVFPQAPLASDSSFRLYLPSLHLGPGGAQRPDAVPTPVGPSPTRSDGPYTNCTVEREVDDGDDGVVERRDVTYMTRPAVWLGRDTTQMRMAGLSPCATIGTNQRVG